jgi:pimeloyl-ACP methyl ester carboxylesterase
VRTIGESVKWYAAQTGGPVGVMGLSFSGGLALVAAADPLYHAEFKFVVAVGSQDSMDRVTRYYRTGEDVRPDGSVEVLPAHEYGPLVLEYEYLEDFIPARDLGPVRAALSTPVYLLHGEADNIIPSAETLWMASELPSAELKAMLVSPVLSHIDITGKGTGPMDEWRLVHFFALVMDAAEKR